MSESFGRRLWTVALTGVPFAVYKAGFGWWEFHHHSQVIGVVAMAWGLIDLLLNLVSLKFPGRVGVCLLSNIGRWLDRGSGRNLWEEVLLGVDTTLAFVIVAVMIWFGRLPLSPAWAGHAWNVAVIFNVVSVGLEQMYRAVREHRRHRAEAAQR